MLDIVNLIASYYEYVLAKYEEKVIEYKTKILELWSKLIRIPVDRVFDKIFRPLVERQLSDEEKVLLLFTLYFGSRVWPVLDLLFHRFYREYRDVVVRDFLANSSVGDVLLRLSMNASAVEGLHAWIRRFRALYVRPRHIVIILVILFGLTPLLSSAGLVFKLVVVSLWFLIPTLPHIVCWPWSRIIERYLKECEQIIQSLK